MMRIGKYEIESEVKGARDSRIQVFRALDGDTGRAVTLKLLAKRGDKFADRFRSEVSRVARLRVPSVIVIYELGEHEGCPFVVVPDLGNDHLGLAIEDKRGLTLLQKILNLEEVATGAAEMHRSGLAYLGIRPRAVALADESAIIQDFGVVHLFDAHGESLYLSPEESNSGYPSDTLCDIFAFGVVCYQFLAGVHPFHPAGEALSRDPRKQPVPLREAAADCPQKLEELASRLLEIRRDFRYQTFDDVLDDLRPIVQSLKRARGANLWSDGRRLMSEGKLEQAQSIVRQALWLHPDDSEASQISADLSALMRERRLKARIEELWLQADQAAANRRFFRAVEILTTASRLDESGLGTQPRLEAMQTRLDNSLAASELAVEARLLREQGKLEQARARIAAALERDAEEPEALRLLDLVDSALDRQNRLRSLTSEAGSLLSQQRFADAVRLLETAGPELSSDPGVSDLLSRARAAVERAKAVEQAVARCHQFREVNRFDKALDEVKRALATFPDEAVLRTLRNDVEAQAESYQRTEAVRQALDEVQWLLAEDRPDLAVRFLKQRCLGPSSEPALQARLAELEQMLTGWEQRRLLKCLEDFCSHDDGEASRPDRAIALLPVIDTLTSAEIPGEVADAAKRLRKRMRAHATVAEVRVYLAAGNIDHAEKTLREEVDAGEASPVLAKARKEVEVCREYLRERQRAQVSLGRHQLAEAEQILVRLAAPDRAGAQTLLEVVRAQKNASDDAAFRENVRERARKMTRDGSQDEAGDLLRNLAILFPDEPAVRPAAAEAARPLRAPAGRPIYPAAMPSPTAITLQPEPRDGLGSRMKGILIPVSSRVPKVALVAGMITLSAGGAAIWRFTRGAAPTAAARLVSVPAVVQESSSRLPLSVAQISPAVPVPAKREPAAPVDRVVDDSSGGKRAAARAPEVQRATPRAFVNPKPEPAAAVSAGPMALPAPPSAAAGSFALDAPPVPVVIGQGTVRIAAPAPPKPAPEAPVPQARGGNVQLPKLISGPAPAYPILARQQHVSGTVDVEAVVDKQGYVKSVTAVRGNPVLTKAAIQAVAGWRFQPASIDGDPVEAKTTVTLHFENPPR